VEFGSKKSKTQREKLRRIRELAKELQAGYSDALNERAKEIEDIVVDLLVEE
jgi:archaellum biogenesis protein FlaJ (TadC family)